jgi:ferredoxin
MGGKLPGSYSHQSSTFFTSFIAIQKEDAMKVKIDYGLCMGDRNCHKVCPEVFDFDEDQLRSIVRVARVPAQMEDKVRQAAEECAPGAILIEE